MCRGALAISAEATICSSKTKRPSATGRRRSGAQAATRNPPSTAAIAQFLWLGDVWRPPPPMSLVTAVACRQDSRRFSRCDGTPASDIRNDGAAVRELGAHLSVIGIAALGDAGSIDRRASVGRRRSREHRHACRAEIPTTLRFRLFSPRRPGYFEALASVCGSKPTDSAFVRRRHPDLQLSARRGRSRDRTGTGSDLLSVSRAHEKGECNREHGALNQDVHDHQQEFGLRLYL